jgi:hypothetical protein
VRRPEKASEAALFGTVRAKQVTRRGWSPLRPPVSCWIERQISTHAGMDLAKLAAVRAMVGELFFEVAASVVLLQAHDPQPTFLQLSLRAARLAADEENLHLAEKAQERLERRLFKFVC